MPVSVAEYQRLKQLADKKRDEAARATGALDAEMAKLQANYGVATLDEATARLDELKTEEAEAEEAYNTALAAFKEKWPDLA